MKITVKTNDGRVHVEETSSSRIVLGRSTRSDFVVEDEVLSRQHCLIEFESGVFYVTDLESANGVYLNQERIPATQRTPIPRFSQLQIANLDCNLEDNEKSLDLEQTPDKNPVAYLSSMPTGERKTIATKQVNRHALNNPLKMKNSQSKKKPLSLEFIVAASLAAGVCIYYFFESPSSTEEAPATVVNEPQVPAYKKNMKIAITIPNEFHLNHEYEDIDKKKTCEIKKEFCTDMSLDSAKREGLVFIDKNAYVFINALSRKSLTKYSLAQNDNQINTLIALDMILNSQLLNLYVLKELDHVHVVLVTDENKIEKVIRFHPLKFVPGQTPRFDIITTLAAALQNGKTDQFWTFVLPFLEVKNVQEN